MRLIAIQDFYYLGSIGLMWLSSRLLSGRLKPWLIASASQAAFRLSRDKRGIMERNLLKAMGGGLGPERKRSILQGAFREFWQDFFAWLPTDGERLLAERIEIRGQQHLEAARQKGRGVILWESNGFGRRVLAKQALHLRGIRVHQVHGPNNLGGFLAGAPVTWVRRSWVRPFFDSCEQRFVESLIYLPRSDSLKFGKHLRDLLVRNEVVCVTGDGKEGRKFLHIPFLHQQEPFATGMVTLAKQTGATILPLFCWHEQEDQIRLRLGPPIDINTHWERDRLLRESLGQFARELETLIRRFPEQYRNWHLVGSASGTAH